MKTLFQELMEVTKYHQGSQIDLLKSPDKKETLAKSLWMQYVQARDCYLYSITPPPPLSPVLSFPFQFFYIRKDLIYTCFLFQNGSRSQTNQLTKTTFRYLLENRCGVPYVSGELLNRFFDALCGLLQKFPRSRSEIILEQIKRYDLYFYYTATAGHAFQFSSAKNIYVNISSLGLPAVFKSALNWKSDLKFPYRLQKDYFTAILWEHQHSKDKKVLIEDRPQDLSLVFRVSNKFYFLEYCHTTDNFNFANPSANSVTLDLKALPAAIGSSPYSISENLQSFFKVLCHADIRIIKQFAIFFAKALSPNKSGLTVFYSADSSITEALYSSLQNILKPVIADQRLGSEELLPSLNKLTKHQRQLKLFLEQDNGKCVVFVRDILPSEKAIPHIRKLVTGRSVSVKSNILPNQHYSNRMHLICITDNSKSAAFLQKELKADRINLPKSSDDGFPSIILSADDIQWLHTTFLPYGLKLLTLQAKGLPDPAPFQSDSLPPVPSPEEELDVFLDTCCEFHKECFCNTDEVYQWYKSFIQAIHPGEEAIWTKIIFNKKLREALPKHYHGRVIYRKHHYSRSAPSLFSYVGLKLSHIPEPIAVLPQNKSDFISDFLEYINKYKVKFPQQLQIQVSGRSIEDS